TLTFQAGQSMKTVSIPISNDESVEPDRTFTFTLSNPTGGTLGESSATMTIRNDEVVAVLPPVIRNVITPTQRHPTPLPTKQPPGPKHIVNAQTPSPKTTVHAKAYAHSTVMSAA